MSQHPISIKLSPPPEKHAENGAQKANVEVAVQASRKARNGAALVAVVGDSKRSRPL